MKRFDEWVGENGGNLEEVVPGMPNLGQQAIPVNQQAYPGTIAQSGQVAGQQPQPKQVSLGDFAAQVKDPTWHQLYDTFTQAGGRDQRLGMALYQAAQSGDMSGLQPFVQKHQWAQPVR